MLALPASTVQAATDARSLLTAPHHVNFAPADESIDEPFELARLTLLAENLDPATIEIRLARLAHWAEQLDVSGSVVGSVWEKTAAIHHFMHAQALTGGYQAEAHSLAELLDSGRYNCLSATLLLVALATPYDLPLVALESPGHITAALVQGDAIAIVETTLPDWRPEPATKLSPARGGGRLVAGRQLLAAVHYNRGWQLLHSGHYAAAARANAEALRLDGQCLPARKNLLASINNWAVALCAARQYAHALEVLRAGQAIDGTFAPFEANRQHALRCARQAVGRDGPAAQ